MNALNSNLAKMKKDIAKKQSQFSKYLFDMNQINRISALPDSLNIKDSLGIGRKVFNPEYITISNFASLTIHFFWKDGVIHVHQSNKNNYATNNIDSIVSLNSALEVDSWLKEIKYFIMQKCGWSSSKYRQFKASTYSFILEALNQRDQYISTVGNDLSISSLIHKQNSSDVFNPNITVSKICKDINFVSPFRFVESNQQGAASKEEMVFMYRVNLLPVIRFGAIANHGGIISKTQIFDPLALIANKNISQDTVSKKMKSIIDLDVLSAIEVLKNSDVYELSA
jgi:hypothetical protein